MLVVSAQDDRSGGAAVVGGTPNRDVPDRRVDDGVDVNRSVVIGSGVQARFISGLLLKRAA